MTTLARVSRKMFRIIVTNSGLSSVHDGQLHHVCRNPNKYNFLQYVRIFDYIWQRFKKSEYDDSILRLLGCFLGYSGSKIKMTISLTISVSQY